MIFIKVRKLRRQMVADAWNGEIFFESMDANNIQYRLFQVAKAANIRIEAERWAYVLNWDPDKVLVNWINSQSKEGIRLVMLINYPNMDEFFSIINRTIKLKAFL